MITFRSEVGPDVMMFDEVAQRMMELMGKDKDAARGVVSVEQLPQAIAQLKAAVAADKAQRRGAAAEEADDGDDTPRVALSQRALPLIELLEISLAREVPVTWGV